uniref:NAD-dependent epimerase/dehydratase family protein n=1 Tax=Roseihalotalea indica TaxID=2867963 RepID=A0AA49JE29_9BACT|nr:NAD-dependent epimerase/dehydratase family protein [Tunicatimonas sp. TK19036]
MKVIITGGGGFLGSQLTQTLCRHPYLTLAPGNQTEITEILAADLFIPEAVRSKATDLVTFLEADIADQSVVDAMITGEKEFVLFHLAAVVSGAGERDFDLAMQVNLDGTRYLFEACRRTDACPRVVFASSLAVYGGAYTPPVVSDTTKPLPQTTYGMTKLMGELMINDYSRKGFLDGRALRLPTIFIRPGRPNAAASSFASGLFREPLKGVDYHLPVSLDQEVPLLGYRKVVEAFIKAMECDSNVLGDDRTLTLPSRRYVVKDMINTLQAVAEAKGITLGKIIEEPNDYIISIVKGWPLGTEAARAEALGITADQNAEEVILHYIEDFLS